jgi:ABC-type transport system involved in cytochrome c biogenesis permease component
VKLAVACAMVFHIKYLDCAPLAMGFGQASAAFAQTIDTAIGKKSHGNYRKLLEGNTVGFCLLKKGFAPQAGCVTGLLSIVWRELAVAAKQISTHRGRLIAGAIVTGFFGTFVALQHNPPNILGPMLFSVSSTLLFLQALVSGARYTADALSEERREGTLGLLFLTELHSTEVVLGKMVARSLRGFYAMIAALPVFTFCILLGGVRGVDAANMAILLVTTMIFSLATGMYVSSRTTEDKTAFIGTVGLLTGLCVMPPLVWKLFATATKSGALDFLLYASPFYAMQTAPRIAMITGEFFRSIVCLWMMTGIFLLLAAQNLSMAFKSDFAQPIKIGRENILDREVFRGASRKRLDKNPFRWLLEREQLYRRILAGLALIAIVGPLTAVTVLKRGAPGPYAGIAIHSLYAMHVLWKLLLASDALRRLHHDRRSGALEQLLVTPLPVKQILTAQLNRTFRLFLPSAIALAIGNFIFFSDWVSSSPHIAAWGGAIFLIFDGRTLIWQAMLQALKPARYPIALLRAVGLTLLPPIIVLMLIQTFVGGDIETVYSFWFASCAIYNAILIRRSKSKLESDFRELASQTVKPSMPKRQAPKPLRWLLMLDTSASRAG